MAKQPIPTPVQLRQLLRYEPETGSLFWLERPRELFSRDGDWKRWNTCFRGKVAGSRMKIGYVSFNCFNVLIYAHRAAWALVHGEWPEGDVDHINGDGLDNRLQNLRAVPHKLNQRNLKLTRTNGTGVVGVQLHPNGKYRAMIGGGKYQRHLGYFVNLEDAISARDKAKCDLGYHANHGRS